MGSNGQTKSIPAGVTLLGQGIRQQQARGQSTGATYGSNGLALGGLMNNTYQPGQSLNGIRNGKLDMLPQNQTAAPPQQPTTSISEAAYFIQRVNRILQNQGGETSTTVQHKTPAAIPQKQTSLHCTNVNQLRQQQQAKLLQAETSPPVQLSSLGLGTSQNNQSSMAQQYYP